MYRPANVSIPKQQQRVWGTVSEAGVQGNWQSQALWLSKVLIACWLRYKIGFVTNTGVWCQTFSLQFSSWKTFKKHILLDQWQIDRIDPTDFYRNPDKKWGGAGCMPQHVKPLIQCWLHIVEFLFKFWLSHFALSCLRIRTLKSRRRWSERSVPWHPHRKLTWSFWLLALSCPVIVDAGISAINHCLFLSHCLCLSF